MAEKRAHPRLASDVFRGYVGLISGIVPAFGIPFLFVLAPGQVDLPVMFAGTYLICWALIGFITSALTVLTFRRASGTQLVEWLRATTPKTGRARFIYLVNGGGAASWAITGSIIAVAAVLVLSFNPEFKRDPVLVWSGVAVVVASLLLTISAYAVRYAREQAASGGVTFAKTPEPVFADYFYLAVQVATTFSSSDVTIETTRMRRLVTANSLISFTFNTVIVALLVSVLVSSAS